MLRYGSICSGIEAASVAWHPLGWEPAFFAEIEKFPSAVLAQRWPDVPNLGDFTKIQECHFDGSIDLLVGGTPCQSFSVAGLRGGLDDERGNLALEYLRLAKRLRARWFVWENVPGVLSSNGGRDFGALLGGLVELGYGFAYRILDAQYVRVESHPRAVPQRRRRVFVVGHIGDWRPAAAVLFEREGLQGNSPPRRKKGQGIAPTIAARTRGGGGLGTDFDCDGGLISGALTASYGATGATPDEAASGCLVTSHNVSRSLLAKGNDSFDETLQSYVVANPLLAGGHANNPLDETLVTHSLRAEGFDASEDGTGRGTPIVPVAFSCKDDGRDASADHAPTLRAMGHNGSHANAGGQLAVAIQERAVSENPETGPDGKGWRDDGTAYTLEARTVPQSVAKDFAVRRLAPRECERLQGFPDDYTAITYRSKPAADGPRYKALGNSMAVNVMSWIGQRIQMVDDILREAA